jgi:hypothetical protein
MTIMQTRIGKEISRVRLSLRSLDKALLRLSPALTAEMRRNANGVDKPARPVSARTRTARVLQGRYMGYMRQLKPRQKAQVRRIRESKGVKAAITRARILAE